MLGSSQGNQLFRLIAIIVVGGGLWGAMSLYLIEDILDDWNYAKTILAPPGTAMQNFVLIIGFVASVRNLGKNPRIFRVSAFGFGLVLTLRFILSLFGGWLASNRHEVQPIVYRYHLWFHIATDIGIALGFTMIVAALLSKQDEAG